MLRKIYVSLLLVQGLYTCFTALWGLLHIDSFMQVTGPKTDIWLVKTVSAVLLCIGISMLSEVVNKTIAVPLMLLFSLQSIALATVDFYYTAADRIWEVYKLDGLAQVLFATIWLYLFTRRPSLREKGMGKKRSGSIT